MAGPPGRHRKVTAPGHIAVNMPRRRIRTPRRLANQKAARRRRHTDGASGRLPTSPALRSGPVDVEIFGAAALELGLVGFDTRIA